MAQTAAIPWIRADSGRELVELATAYFPQDFDFVADADAGPFVLTAMLGRMVGTMKAILAQHSAELEADAGAAVRGLFEQAVYLAWIAADPSVERIQAWRKVDLKARLVADDDGRAHGNPLFTDRQRAHVEARVAELSGDRLVLASVAEEADQYWATVPGREPSDAPCVQAIALQGSRRSRPPSRIVLGGIHEASSREADLRQHSRNALSVFARRWRHRLRGQPARQEQRRFQAA